jgi:hypothetical protein
MIELSTSLFAAFHYLKRTKEGSWVLVYTTDGNKSNPKTQTFHGDPPIMSDIIVRVENVMTRKLSEQEQNQFIQCLPIIDERWTLEANREAIAKGEIKSLNGTYEILDPWVQAGDTLSSRFKHGQYDLITKVSIVFQPYGSLSIKDVLFPS